MKRYVKHFITVILCFSSLACSNNEENMDLSQNEKQRDEAFEQILNDDELLDEFMLRLMQDSGSLHHMMENQHFMHNMFSYENMGFIMHHNKDIDEGHMREMMERIGDDTIRHHDMMHGR